MVRLESILNSWKAVREDTALAVEEFPAAELDYKPTPEVDSFRQISVHIFNAGNALAGMLLDGETMLMGPEFREKVKKYFVALPADADAATIAAELRKTIEAPLAALATQSADWYAAGRPPGDADGDGAVRQRARNDASGAVVRLHADERPGAGDYAPPPGEAGRTLIRLCNKDGSWQDARSFV